MFMNQMDVEGACERAMHGKNAAVRPYADYMLHWLRIVNTNSDGWAYWKAGSAAAAPLLDLIQEATTGPMPNQARWNKAIGRIKAVVTRQNAKYHRTDPIPLPPPIESPRIIEVSYSVLCLEADFEAVREAFSKWFFNAEMPLYGGASHVDSHPKIPKAAVEFFESEQGQ